MNNKNKIDYTRLDERLKDIWANDMGDMLDNFELRKDVADKLYIFQLMHTQNLAYCLNKNNIAIDGSDTGTGKTYAAIAVCAHLNLVPLIICPKSIMTNWTRVCEHFNITPLTIVNYETIKKGKQYESLMDYNKRIKCPYISVLKNDKQKGFRWHNLPHNAVIIFDEAHNCKIKNSQNTKLLTSLKESHAKIMLLSATLADKPDNFAVFGYMLGFYKTLRKSKPWIKGVMREDSFNKSKKCSALSAHVYPKNGSRMMISELGDKFPKNSIQPDSYNIDDKEIINDNYKLIQECLKKLKNKKASNKLVGIVRARQKIELLKLPLIISMAKEYVDEGFSVVIFVNFNDSIDNLSHSLKTNCVIHGKQSQDERQANIDDFQSNNEKIIICNIKSGGQSISLNDVHGCHPRISLISPSFSSTELIQCLGRIYRINSKSPAIQKIIFCSGTIEDKICSNIKKKMKFISKLNNDDLLCDFDEPNEPDDNDEWIDPFN